MTRYIAFLRALNVGGHTVRMEILRELFKSLDYLNVETFIASGNVVFESQFDDTLEFEKTIHLKFEETFGFKSEIFIRTTAELAAIAQYQPFPADVTESAVALNVAFLKSALDESAIKKLMALKTNIDDFQHHKREIYWICKKKQSESTISNAVFEKALGRPSTLRGLNTVRKMAAKYCSPYCLKPTHQLTLPRKIRWWYLEI